MPTISKKESLRIILDNSAFVHLIDLPQYEHIRLAFFERIKAGSLHHIGTFEFLEELFLVNQKHPKIYLGLLDRYWTSVEGSFIFPWNRLVQHEIEKKRPLSQAEKYLSPEELIDLKRIAFLPTDNLELAEQINQKKQNFATGMNQALQGLMSQLSSNGHSLKEIRVGFKNWYRSIHSLIQEWIERVFHITGVPYYDLPHTKAFIEFFLCRHYEVIALNIEHKANDLYDRGYYVDAAETGFLLTDDRRLSSTCALIPEKIITVQILDEFLI